ncbi:MAG: hypothetical protein EOM54_08360 [Clostridia bacterium]|nr:hypothetical protein [Clostridia bacterium]
MMKSRSIPVKRNRILAFLMVLTLALGLFILSGCSSSSAPAETTEPPAEETEEQTQQTDEPVQQPETTQPVNHVIDYDPEPLEKTDEALSLEGYGAKGALADVDLSILDMLTYSAQDEYLAHVEYAAIIEIFGDINPYNNIMSAEETHLAFLREVYDTYDLEFPEDTSAEHIIIPDTLLNAAETGVQAEIDNIAMYELFLSYDLPDNVLEVFTALRDGSQSHLLAFQKQVDRLS